MPPLLGSGKLTLAMKLLVESNNLLALFTESYRDIGEMMDRFGERKEGFMNVI